MAENETQNDAEQHQLRTQRFIELANAMKDEGVEAGLVSHALMSASGIYATYAIAGNTGGLNQSGVDKGVAVYQGSLEDIQRTKKEQFRRD